MCVHVLRIINKLSTKISVTTDHRFSSTHILAVYVLLAELKELAELADRSTCCCFSKQQIQSTDLKLKCESYSSNYQKMYHKCGLSIKFKQYEFVFHFVG